MRRPQQNSILGRVISGSLDKGLKAVLLSDRSPEEILASSLVVLEGRMYKYLGIISNIELNSGPAISYAILRHEKSSEKLHEIQQDIIDKLEQKGVFQSMLDIIPLAVARENHVEIADNIPRHMSVVKSPSDEDIACFYGHVDRRAHWSIGSPKSPLLSGAGSAQIPINIDALVRGCFGIFGKSGTGKTFLGNLLAAYIILTNKLKEPVGDYKDVKLLIFDMHSEYGLQVRDQIGIPYASGVGQIFQNDFEVYTPDEDLKRHGFKLESFVVNAKRIRVEDIQALAEVLNFTSTFLDMLSGFKASLKHEFGNRWFEIMCEKYQNDKERARAEECIKSEHGFSLYQSFKSGQARLRRLNRLEFIKWDMEPDEEDSVDGIINTLLVGAKSVIISFGKYGDDKVAYMLIANIIARRLWERCVREIMEGRELKYRVVIFLEEAHKFLGPETYFMTPFGDIARELRKRGVVLCVIDQRPSQIFDDVRAMLWNNFVMCLTEDRDIESISRGLPFPKLFKPVIEKLRRQELLVFGEAVKIPAVVKVPEYKQAIKELREIYDERYRGIEERLKEELSGFS